MLKFEPVESSSLAAVAYDHDTQTLYVRFNNERIYSYQDVPVDVYTCLKSAESVGRFFASQIKNKYKFTELESEP